MYKDYAFDLIEELLTRVDMKVAAGIGPAHHHDDEVANRIQQLVADRGFEKVAV